MHHVGKILGEKKHDSISFEEVKIQSIENEEQE